MRKKTGREMQKNHPRLLSCLQRLGRVFRTRESGMDLRRRTDSSEGLYQETDYFSATLERQPRPGGKANGKSQAKKKMFVKSLSVEPSGGIPAEHDRVVMRKKTLTTFWSNLFGTKIPENRNSGISIQSASYESVNTILSSNSFSFVNPRKYKGKAQKGKRIPIAEPQSEDLSKPKRKVGTLTRLGIKMGLKSKYNLQSCESLQCLSQLESSAASPTSQTGTLNNTFRRKKHAAPPLPRESTLVLLPSAASTLPHPSTVPHCSKTVRVETHPVPNDNRDDHHHNQQHLDANVNNSSVVEPEEEPGTSDAKNPPSQTHSQQDVQEPFKIGLRHKRSVSEGYSAPTPSTSSPMTNHSTSHTLTNTLNRSKTHVRGKRRAPPPPNPFGDPDAPAEEPQPPALQYTKQEAGNTKKIPSAHLHPVLSNLSSKRSITPVPPLNPFEIPEADVSAPLPAAATPINDPVQIPLVSNITTQRSEHPLQQEQISNYQVSLSTNSAAALEGKTQEDDEIVQNLLNARYEEATYQQDQRTTDELTGAYASSSNPNTSYDESMAKFREKGGQASNNSTEALRSVTKDKGGPSSGKKSNVGDICIGASNYSFTDQSQGTTATPPASPQSLSGDAIPGTSSGSTSPYLFSSLSVSSTTSSTNSASPSKLTPRPWYKRATHSGSQTKKSKPLITPVPGMMKFSDIDREAARIVAENRRRSAELESSESAKELITMFNAFNKSQRSPVRGLSTNSDIFPESEPSTSSTACGRSTNATTSSQLLPSAQTDNLEISQGQKPESKLQLTTATSTTSYIPNGYKNTENLPNALVYYQDSKPQASSNGPTSLVTEDSSSKKLAVVQPKSSNVTKISEDNVVVEIATDFSTKKTDSVTVLQTTKTVEVKGNGSASSEEKRSTSTNPIQASYVSIAKDWICPRCTLSNNQWRLTCEACYYKKYSSIQKPLSQATTSSSTDSRGIFDSKKATRVPTEPATLGLTTFANSPKPLAPPCENFLSKIPAKETHEKDEKLSGIKLTEDPYDESYNIARVREARLAFFKKPGGSIETGDAVEAITSTQTKSNDLATNAARSPKVPVLTKDSQDKIVNKEMNVFSDNEDDSIDNLLQLHPPFLKKPSGNLSHMIPNDIGACGNQSSSEPPFGTMQGMPDFSDNSGSRTWNPFHLHRFRPMLESILESSTDMYLGIDNVYQNWNFEKGFPPSPFPPPKIRKAKSLGAGVRKQKEKSGKYQVVIGKDGKLLPLPFASPPKNQLSQNEPPTESSSTSNSDSSDNSNENKSLRHSEMHSKGNFANHRYRQQVVFRNPPSEKQFKEKKLTLEEYRKLGAIPKNYEAYCDEADSLTGNSQQQNNSPKDRKQRRSSKPQITPVSETDSGSDSSRSYFDTVAVTKLLKKLEHAIAKGDHNKAAALAHDLALLRVECVVSKGSSNPKDITIFVYVEDRFMQQGPFEVEVSQHMTVRELKEKIANDWNIPIPFQKWILVNRIADDDNEALIRFSLCQNSLVYLYLVTPQVDALPEAGYTEEILSRSTHRSSSSSRKHDGSASNSRKHPSDNEFSSECSDLGGSCRPSHTEANSNSEQESKRKSQVTTDASTVTTFSNTGFAPGYSSKSFEDSTSSSARLVKSSASSFSRSKTSNDQTTQSVSFMTEANNPDSLKYKKSTEVQSSPEISKSLNQKAFGQDGNNSKVKGSQVVDTVSSALPVKANQYANNTNDSKVAGVSESERGLTTGKNQISIGVSATIKDLTATGFPGINTIPRETNNSLASKNEKLQQQSHVAMALQQRSLTLHDKTSTALTRTEISNQKIIPESHDKQTSLSTASQINSSASKPEQQVPIPTRRNKKKRNEVDKELGSKSENTGTTVTMDLIIEQRKQVKDQDTQTLKERPDVVPTKSLTSSEDITKSCRLPIAEVKSLPFRTASDPHQTQNVSKFSQDTQSSNTPDDPPPLPKKGLQQFATSRKDEIIVYKQVNPGQAQASTPTALPLPARSGKESERKTDAANIPKTNSTVGNEEKEDNVQTYLKMMQKMDVAAGFSINFKECLCSICFTKVKLKEGVILQNCSHSFCRKCLSREIRAKKGSSSVKCPSRENGILCPSTIKDNEITSLLQITTTSLPRR